MKKVLASVAVAAMTAPAFAQSGPTVDSSVALSYITAAGVATLAVIAAMTVFRAANWGASRIGKFFGAKGN